MEKAPARTRAFSLLKVIVKTSRTSVSSCIEDQALANINASKPTRHKREAGSKEGEDRIVNGADAGTQPWLASLAQEFPNGHLLIQCGGSLINRRFVL